MTDQELKQDLLNYFSDRKYPFSYEVAGRLGHKDGVNWERLYVDYVRGKFSRGDLKFLLSENMSKERLHEEWNKIEEPKQEQEPVAWMYDWEDFDGDETFIKYGLITTDKKIFDSPCAMNITPLIKGNSDE